jgi:hypothetical protein
VKDKGWTLVEMPIAWDENQDFSIARSSLKRDANLT